MRRHWSVSLCVLAILSLSRGHGNFSSYKIEDLKKDFEASKQLPLVLFADHVDYNDETSLFHVKGNVVLRHAGRLLCTQDLSYDTEKDDVFLPTFFQLKESTGAILWGACGHFLGQMKTGEIKKARLLTSLRERIAADIVRKKEGTTEFDMASYTPCEKCKDKLDPVWSVHARRIIQDEKESTMTFTDAHLEFLSVPIAYMPHFYFPTKRKSGFLLPYADITPELGFYFGQPYYWTINSSGNNDILITPFVTTKGGVLLATDYRHRLNDGSFSLKGAVNATHSQTYSAFPKPVHLSSARGYANGNIDYNFTPHWRLRSDEWWASDKTFLSTRPFFGQMTEAFLESKTAVEGFYQHHFAQIQGLRYQGLQNGDIKQTTPYLYPITCYSYVTPDLIAGSYAMLDIETLSLYQSVGTQMQRATVGGRWMVPLETSSGQIFTPFTYVEGAFYRAKAQPTFSMYTIGKSRSTARLFPQGGVDWKWPMTSNNHPLFVVTPMVQMIMGAFHVNKYRIPNEDSLGVTFTDSVLFEPNRFPGHDRVDDGARSNYAVLGQMFLANGQSAQVFFGQSYSFSKPPLIMYPFGIRKGASDFVGHVETNFQNPKVNIRYRFRFDQKTFSGRYHEVASVIGPPAFSVSGGYIASTMDLNLINPIYNQLFLVLTSQFCKFWTGKIFVTQNFKSSYQSQKLLDKGLGIAYEDECFSCSLTIQHSYYRMQDLKPGLSVDFSIYLKNLGGFQKKTDRFTRRTDLEPTIR